MSGLRSDAGQAAKCPHCGRFAMTYFTADGALHLFGHRIEHRETNDKPQGPWCPMSGAKVEATR